MREFVCVVCGASGFVDGRGRPAKYCSFACRSRDKRGHRGSYSFACERCGVEVEHLTNKGPRARFCSETCRSNSEWDRRRAREKDAFVEDVPRFAVFARDDFICQLCGDPLDMDAIFPASLSPSLDHIVPLALGGLHQTSNAQAAHLGCNARKGARLVAS